MYLADSYNDTKALSWISKKKNSRIMFFKVYNVNFEICSLKYIYKFKLIKKNSAARVNIFFVTRIFGNKNIFFLALRECLCDSCTSSFLPLLIFDWRTFSRRVTTRWWRQSAKNQVSTNQNSRTICKDS